MTDPLGRLERVDLRDIWATEAQDFTPWLAQEENLSVLGDTISMELELEAQEKDVGPFRADILCKDTVDGDWVLIENQLERTDHLHLGQLLTYAAGLEAVTIVWVASTFTDEHRSALDWLNDITDERFRFFGLEVELWRIAASPPAPKFNVISKPNDWSRSVGQAARRLASEPDTEAKAKRLMYWTGLKEYLANHQSSLRSQKPSPDNWTNLAIGRTGIWLSASANSRDKRLTAELYLCDENAKAYFHLLKRDRAAIESGFGEELSWQELPDKKASRIMVHKENTDPTDESDWPNQHSWMAERLERLNRAFRQRVKALDASDWSEADNGEEKGPE